MSRAGDAFEAFLLGRARSSAEALARSIRERSGLDDVSVVESDGGVEVRMGSEAMRREFDPNQMSFMYDAIHDAGGRLR